MTKRWQGRTAALLATVAFLPGLIGHLRRGGMLDVREIKQRLDAGEAVLILDVRTTADFTGEQGHIAGAVNIPVEDLAQRLEAAAAPGSVLVSARTHELLDGSIETRAHAPVQAKGFAQPVPVFEVVTGEATRVNTEASPALRPSAGGEGR